MNDSWGTPTFSLWSKASKSRPLSVIFPSWTRLPLVKPCCLYHRVWASQPYQFPQASLLKKKGTTVSSNCPVYTPLDQLRPWRWLRRAQESFLASQPTSLKQPERRDADTRSQAPKGTAAGIFPLEQSPRFLGFVVLQEVRLLFGVSLQVKLKGRPAWLSGYQIAVFTYWRYRFEECWQKVWSSNCLVS